MRPIMCVRLTQWPIDRLKRAKRLSPRDPIVLVQSQASRQLVVCACNLARSQGVKVGMTLVEAQAVCASLYHEEHRPDQDLEFLEILARWMFRYSPMVALEPPDAIALDVGGCERLFGSLDRLLHRVSLALAKFKFRHGIAIAPTLGAAWAIASYGKSPRIVDAGKLQEALAPLPVSGLRLPTDTVITLGTLGIRSIGQLMELPRETLPSRFGSLLLQRLDQALGHTAEPLVYLEHSHPIQARLDFECEIDSLEGLEQAARQLLDRVTHELRQRGVGARRLVAEFLIHQQPSMERTVDLSRPTASPSVLFNLMRCVIEGTKADSGFVGLKLSVPIFERMNPEQLALLDAEEEVQAEELDRLVERLKTRMGDGAVLYPQLTESHLPERTFTLSERRLPNRAAPHRPAKNIRPLRLLSNPAEIRCVTSASLENQGQPILFSFRQKTFDIAFASGPERIAGLWWEGRNKTRDYFDVGLSNGTRLWIFRVVETDCWYLHGLFNL